MWILAVSALVKNPNLCLEACPGGLVDAFPIVFDFFWSRTVFALHIIAEFLKSIDGNMPEHVHIPYSMYLT
jgi:hypothetical protein